MAKETGARAQLADKKRKRLKRKTITRGREWVEGGGVDNGAQHSRGPAEKRAPLSLSPFAILLKENKSGRSNNPLNKKRYGENYDIDPIFVGGKERYVRVETGRVPTAETTGLGKGNFKGQRPSQRTTTTTVALRNDPGVRDGPAGRKSWIHISFHGKYTGRRDQPAGGAK